MTACEMRMSDWSSDVCSSDLGKIEFVPLDADFGRSASPGPAVDLSKWNLAGTSFALMVSTVEPRKNHILAFDAWAELIRIHGADAIPLLVCAGRRGWRYDQIFARPGSDQAPKARAEERRVGKGGVR